ncbi:nuclear transport factor 2 family protein [Jeotgalibacillus sp. ET6]|uniref:nuclear transport factor 2 family protein n=1 Tax=Jeotgalibacillus sp. ET6 TaxID=3037260 RepID=UPI0024184006|nr:nuclear transport factor 2 family protein [Jeotgalibacillus sp. ET6]MDG5473122.1 nuclear transport factor 2 family protein [Jeotgalibacillus sp. ET6]
MDIKQLPQIIQQFIAASNKPDPKAFLDCFADEAIVVDERQERVGKPAIKKWSEDFHFGANVKLDPITAQQNDEEIIVTFKLSGDYDKTGLPDPLLLDFHFQLHDDTIKSLLIN